MSAHNILSKLSAASRQQVGGQVFAYGKTVPSDGAAGYAPGCLFIDINAAAGSQMFINEGTATAADFNATSSVSASATLTGKTLTSPIITSPSMTKLTEVVAATNAIAASESGTTFFLNSSTEFASTLPAPAAGLEFEFIVTAAPSGASYTIVTASSANIIKGQVFSGDLDAAGDTDSETSGGDTISFVDSKAVAGDRVILRCDGTNWFAYGFCKAFDAITITTAS